MTRYLNLLAVAAIMLFSSSAYADENIAVVIQVRGEVSLTPKNSVKSSEVRKGQILKNGDKLETGTDAFCALKFLDDKSLLRIKEKSSCVIEGKKDGKAIDKNIFVEIGSFFASLFQPRGKFQVTTPTSVASVKGTKFWTVQFAQSGESRYIVTEGIVEVKNRAGKVLVRAGQTAVVASRSQLPKVRLSDNDDLPEEIEKSSTGNTLDFEFENDAGQKRVLRINLENQD